MKNNQFKIVLGLLTLIIILLIGTWVCVFTPVYVGRTCKFTTETFTPDRVKLTISWTAKYKAPIVLSAEMKEDIEKKVQVYGQIRIYAFTLIHSAEELSKMSMEEVQKEFDYEDIVGEIMKMSPDVARKLRNIKYLRLNTIKFERPTKSNERIIEFPHNAVMTQL